MIISLIGFMGTGKSSVGKYLAKKLDFLFIDTDSEIELEMGITIADIFQEYGEEYFREIEEKVLENILQSVDNAVLSTGGGIVLSSKNRAILREKSLPIVLQASVDEIYNRVKDDYQRPLLDVPEPKEVIEKLLNQRKDCYNSFKIKIYTNDKSIEEISDLIINNFIREEGESLDE
ncbi:MAG: shikimate kinase [Halanaerobiaceae bacterium]